MRVDTILDDLQAKKVAKVFPVDLTRTQERERRVRRISYLHASDRRRNRLAGPRRLVRRRRRLHRACGGGSWKQTRA